MVGSSVAEIPSKDLTMGNTEAETQSKDLTMGNTEAGATSKSEIASSPAQEQVNMHAYPNWAGIQAYYAPGMTMPHPYFNSAVAPGHPPQAYMWGTPPPMMPPYGPPYSAIYSPGGVYAHPSIPPGSNSQGHGVPSSSAVCDAMVATPLSIATPAKSSSNKEKGLMKKLKGFDGLVVTIGNGDAGSGDASQSGDYGTEGTSDGSDGNTAGKEQNRKKRSCDGMVSTGAEVPAHDGVASELWVKSERELKRERRKQSNRESARRSRLRKQAETEELATKVETLNVENLNLRTELSRLAEKSEKLRLENAALLEKLKNVELQQAGVTGSNQMDIEGAPPVSTENFLARVNNSGSVTRNTQQENEVHENSTSGTKLHQLLESSSRADAVAAG